MPTMTLNTSDAEHSALEQLAVEQDMSKTAVIKQALRLYQLVHAQTKAGWEMDFVDPHGRSHRQVMGKAMLGLGPLPATPASERA